METFTGLLGAIPAIIILVATIKLASKRPGSESTMMVVGSAIGVCTTAFYSLAVPFLMRNGSQDSIAGYFGTVRVVGIAGGFLFSIGLLLFIQKVIADKNQA